MTAALKRTPLYEAHTSLKARMVPFAGWEMPVQYGSILGETKAVRSGAGLFDVSHMGRLYISGPQSHLLMDWILTADASSLRENRARYAMICNEEGGIIDDAVFYRLYYPGYQKGSLDNQALKGTELDAQGGKDHFLLVCNASNRQHVLPWMQAWATERFPNTTIDDRTEKTAMIALQGPSTPGLLDRLSDARPSGLRPFSSLEGTVSSKPALVGRTGYTGEDGFELMVEASDAAHVWEALIDEGAVPCGLGARDVLRLEAGLALHGNDIGPSTTPLEAGLERFVRLDKEFVGAEALRNQKQAGVKSRLVGLMVQARSIPRTDYPILVQGAEVGRVTSGTYSPTLDRPIAMGYVLVDFARPGQSLLVDVRGRHTDAEVVPLPFYHRRRPEATERNEAR